MRKKSTKFIEISNDSYEILSKLAAQKKLRSVTAYIESFASFHKDKHVDSLKLYDHGRVIQLYEAWTEDGVFNLERLAACLSDEMEGATLKRCNATIERWKKRQSKAQT